MCNELGWKILLHPQYSLDLTSLDYHLFRSISHNMTGLSFNNEVELKMGLDEFFESKSNDFYRRVIKQLVGGRKQ